MKPCQHSKCLYDLETDKEQNKPFEVLKTVPEKRQIKNIIELVTM